MNNATTMTIIFLLLLVFVLFFQIEREGFSQPWSNKTIHDFLLFQKTTNPGIVFDTSIIQDQASEESAKELLQTGKWRWSPEVEELYMDAVSQNPYIRTSPEDSANTAKTIYNENAILQILNMQSPQGQFLLHGVKIPDADVDAVAAYGVNSGLISNKNTVIRCQINPKTNMPQLLKSRYIGNDGIFNARQYENTFLESDSQDMDLDVDLDQLRQWCV